jgi:hypothetical protein
MKKWAIITLVLASIIGLFAATNDAFAFGRRGRCSGFRSCNTTFCAPIVHHAVVVKEVITPVFAYPVLVPAYQFQYVPTTYAVPTVPVTGYPQAYPVVPQAPGYGYQPQYGMPQGYPQVQGQYGQYGMQQPQGFGANPQQQFNLSRKDQIRELAKALIEEMNKMADGQGDNGPPPVQGQQPPQTQAPGQPDPQLTQFVLGSLNRTCAQCHTGVGAKKGFQIFTQPGHLNQNVNWKRVKEELVAEHMPPKDTQFHLVAQERTNILEWLRQIGVN